MPMIDCTLAGYQEKGYTVGYIGTEDMEGVEALKVEVVKEGEKVEYCLFDPETYYEIMNIRVDEVDGKEVVSETMYSNFKEQGGIVFPFSMQQANPMMEESVITVTTTTLDPEVDMKIFNMPAKK